VGNYPAGQRSLRLLYVVHTLNPGGTEQLVVKMALHFAAQYEVFVLCLDEPGLWAEQLRSQGIPVTCLWRQPGFDLSVAIRIAAFCRRQRIDVIHAHQFTPWHYSVLAKFFYPFPKVILEEHGRHYPEVTNPKRALFNRFVGQPLTRIFVAVSQDIRERMQVYEGVSKERIRVIYNGSEPVGQIADAERSELRQSLGISSDDFVIGTVGRFDPIKNLPLLLRSFKDIHQQKNRVKALLVGDGPEMDRVRRLIAELNLDASVILTGYRRDAARLTAVMDLFVLASFSEGTSMALLEAMAAGIPAVVTAVGGNPEIVVAGQTGWVVPSADQPAMVHALHAAIDDAASLQSHGVAARSRFASEFSLERMFNDYQNLYQEMEGS